MSKVIGNTVGTTFNPNKLTVDVPTKLSELENDLSSFTLGNTTIGKMTSNTDSFVCGGILQMQAKHMTIRSKQGLNLFSSVATNIEGNVTIKGNVVINDVAYPENNTDAASKEYVDDAIYSIDVPTKMSELEQDLSVLNFDGIVKYSASGIQPAISAPMDFTIGFNNLNLRGGSSLSISSFETKIGNVVAPTASGDAANKEYVDKVYDYVDDITGDISTALDTILAMQSQYVGVSE
jgi:hypothetical protein